MLPFYPDSSDFTLPSYQKQPHRKSKIMNIICSNHLKALSFQHFQCFHHSQKLVSTAAATTALCRYSTPSDRFDCGIRQKLSWRSSSSIVPNSSPQPKAFFGFQVHSTLFLRRKTHSGSVDQEDDQKNNEDPKHLTQKRVSTIKAQLSRSSLLSALLNTPNIPIPKPLMDRLAELAAKSYKQWEPQVTPFFLRPQELAALEKAWCNLIEIRWIAYGGYAQAERKKVMFYRSDAPPESLASIEEAKVDGDDDDDDNNEGNQTGTGKGQKMENDFEDATIHALFQPYLTPLEIGGTFLFDPPSYSDFLGALTSFLSRDLLGDIVLLQERGAHVIVSSQPTFGKDATLGKDKRGENEDKKKFEAVEEENEKLESESTDEPEISEKNSKLQSDSSSSSTGGVVNIIQMCLQQVRTVPVTVRVISWEEFGGGSTAVRGGGSRIKAVQSVEKSLRVDSVASAGFGMSRAKMTDRIKGGLVRINYEAVKSTSKTVKEGDVVLLDGRGKLEIEKIDQTAKGNYRIQMKRYM